MTTNHGGANYFLRQVHTCTQHANKMINTSNSQRNQISELLNAPYKGMKQTRSAGAVLSIMDRALKHDLKKIRQVIDESLEQSNSQTMVQVQPLPTSLSNASVTTEKGAHHVPSTNNNPAPVNLTKLRFQAPKSSGIKHKFRITPSSGIKLKFKIPKPSGKLSPTTEFNGISKNNERQTRIKFKLADKDRLPRDQENQFRRRFNLSELPEELPKEPIIKLKFKVSPAKEYTPKLKLNFQPPTVSQRPRLILRLRPEEQYQIQPKVEPKSEDDKNIEIDNEFTNDKGEADNALIAAFKANNEQYRSTRYYAVKLSEPQTPEEIEQQELVLAAEREADNMKLVRQQRFFRSPNCDYLKALTREAKRPTLTPSQINRIQQHLSTSRPKPKRTYDQQISAIASKSLHRAEEVISTKTKIIKLIRQTELNDNTTPNRNPIHVLSAIPHYLFKTNKTIMGGGRIEYGTEAEGIWSREQCVRPSAAKGVDIAKIDIEALRAKYANKYEEKLKQTLKLDDMAFRNAIDTIEYLDVMDCSKDCMEGNPRCEALDISSTTEWE